MSDRLSPALAYLEHCRARIDNELDHSIRQASVSERLQQAMRYSVLGGGKRIRPALCLAAARAVGSPEDAAVAPACSLELIHAYSLVHDDLPAMDDDDLRRGRPTAHIAFDEATAILAGDALQTLAFTLCQNQHRHSQRDPPPEFQKIRPQPGNNRPVWLMIGGVVVVGVGSQCNILELLEMSSARKGSPSRALLLTAMIRLHWRTNRKTNGFLCQSEIHSS